MLSFVAKVDIVCREHVNGPMPAVCEGCRTVASLDAEYRRLADLRRTFLQHTTDALTRLRERVIIKGLQ